MFVSGVTWKDDALQKEIVCRQETFLATEARERASVANLD